MRKIINVIAFQTAWFASVLGASHSMPWLGVVVVPLMLGLHLALSPNWRPELLLAVGAGVMGFLFDTILVAAGVFSPIQYLLPAPFSPPWMVMLWINFATTLNVSLGSLREKYILAGILGAHIGGKPNVKKIRHFLLTMPDKLDCEKISIGDHAVGDKSEKAGLYACCGDATCNPGCID